MLFLQHHSQQNDALTSSLTPKPEIKRKKSLQPCGSTDVISALHLSRLLPSFLIRFTLTRLYFSPIFSFGMSARRNEISCLHRRQPEKKAAMCFDFFLHTTVDPISTNVPSAHALCTQLHQVELGRHCSSSFSSAEQNSLGLRKVAC